MATAVKLPTQLPNWPELKQKLLAMKSNDGKVETIVELMDSAHDLMIKNYIVNPTVASGVAKQQQPTRRSFFAALGRYLTDSGAPAGRLREFATSTLPFIADRVLAMEQCEERLEYACQQQESVTIISRSLVSSLLAAMFLCILPPHPDELRDSMSNNSFAYFFGGLLPTCPHQAEKLHCILAYFEQLQRRGGPPKQSMAFIRLAVAKEALLSEGALAAASSKQLCQVVPQTVGGIELADSQLLHVNFGNSFLAGGTLQTGVLQEEVNFTIHPELLATVAFMEAMDDNEAVLVFGHERFSQHSGRATQFKFESVVSEENDNNNEDEVDACGFRPSYMLSIDAVPFTWCQVDQLLVDNLLRDINKAFVGFEQRLPKNNQLEKYAKKGIATGNWGCGAFGGHAQIKFFLQWIAASMAGLPVMHYYVFGEDSMRPLQDVVEKLQQKKVTVKQLWLALKQCCKSVKHEEGQEKLTVDMFGAVLNKILCGK